MRTESRLNSVVGTTFFPSSLFLSSLARKPETSVTEKNNLQTTARSTLESSLWCEFVTDGRLFPDQIASTNILSFPGRD